MLVVVAAIKALETAQCSNSVPGLGLPEEAQSTIIASDALHKQSSGTTNSSLSSSSLHFTLTSDKSAPTTHLLNLSMGQQKV